MLRSTRHYFARGNTAHGAHFLYDSAFQGLTKIFLLEGPSGTGKSTTIQRLAEELMKQGLSVELFHSPLEPESLDALIVTDLKIGVADGRECEGLSDLNNTEIVYLYLGLAVDQSQLSVNAQEELQFLQQAQNEAYSKAYNSFAAALRVHDEWEKVYISHMDFPKADLIVQELSRSLFGRQQLRKQPFIRHLFFGAATPRGAVDHIQNLTVELETRIFIKGRPGSGKSTLLKKLAKSAEQRGFDVEVFHCGFDPNSLDMLIIPELSLAIFNSTAPHLYFPNRIGDEILDMYSRTIQPGTDERHATELEPIKIRYTQHMKEATSYLGEALDASTTIKKIYTAATDYTLIDKLYNQLSIEIQQLTIPS